MDNDAVEILLVEDNPDDAALALRALRKINIVHHVVHVEDGEAALDFLLCRGKYANRQPGNYPKVILLDLKLPKIDGLEVLQQLKADTQTRMIPVVMLTSSREDRDLDKSYQLGANSYVVKPVDFHQFAEAIRQLGFYWLLVNQYTR